MSFRSKSRRGGSPSSLEGVYWNTVKASFTSRTVVSYTLVPPTPTLSLSLSLSHTHTHTHSHAHTHTRARTLLLLVSTRRMLLASKSTRHDGKKQRLPGSLPSVGACIRRQCGEAFKTLFTTCWCFSCRCSSLSTNERGSDCSVYVMRKTSSVQFRMVCTLAEKPMCAPPRFSEVSPTLPLKQFQNASESAMALSRPFKAGRSSSVYRNKGHNSRVGTQQQSPKSVSWLTWVTRETSSFFFFL